MNIILLVGSSLLLQLITIVMALRLSLLTGWTKAWVFLSLGITTMGIRRLVTFVDLLTGSQQRSPELFYELIGLIGSGIMLAGVISIEPVIVSFRTAEQRQRALVEKLQDALSKIRTLSGMLPICASCKKIRDDKGYWRQIEAYIRDNSELEFSHGLCPDCAAEAYKELDAIKRTMGDRS